MFLAFKTLMGGGQHRHIGGARSSRRFFGQFSFEETLDQAKDLCANYQIGRFQDAIKARNVIDTVLRQHRKQPAAINLAVDLLQRLAPRDPAIFNPVLNCWKNLMLSNKMHIRRSLFSLNTVLEKLDNILPGDAITTGILVQVMLDQSSIDEAQTYMERQGIELNAPLYNQILKAHADRRHDPAQLESVLKTMETGGVAKDHYTYSILMHYWKDNSKKVKDILDGADDDVVDPTCWSQWVQYETRRHHVVMEEVEKVIIDRILEKDPYQAGLAARDVMDAYSRRMTSWPDSIARAEKFLQQVRHRITPGLEGSYNVWCTGWKLTLARSHRQYLAHYDGYVCKSR